MGKMFSSNFVNKIIDNTKNFWAFFGDYRWKIFGVLIASLSYSLLEGIGIAGLIPLFSLLSPEANVNRTSPIKRYVEDFFGYLDIPFSILTISLLIIGILLLKSALHFISKLSQSYLIEGHKKNLIDKVFTDLLNVKWQYFTTKKRGHLISDLIQQCKKTSVVLRSTLMILTQFASASMYLLTAFFISTEVTSLAIGSIILTGVLLFPLVTKTKSIGHNLVRINKELSNLVEQYLVGFKEIKSYMISNAVVSNLKTKTQDFRDNKINIQILKSLTPISTQLFGALIVIGLILFSTQYFDNQLSESLVICFLFFKTYQKIGNLGQFQNVAQNMASLDEISKILEELESNKENYYGDTEKPSFQNSITLRDVSFAYDTEAPKAKKALENINFTIEKGSFVGIAGESGAGKSTIVNLLLGLLKYDSGEILVDDKALNKINLYEWRSSIGYVPQDGFLINDSVMTNINFFRDFSKHEVIEAAKTAHANNFITELSNEYSTKVGEQGVRLSGGQKQRIVLARAIIHEPEILILDEASSNLDADSESEILEALKNLRGETTIISISHRLSSLFPADKILLLKQGKIVERGSWDSLKKQNGYFSSLLEQQSKRFNSLSSEV